MDLGKPEKRLRIGRAAEPAVALPAEPSPVPVPATDDDDTDR
jgi:hypothetical protein